MGNNMRRIDHLTFRYVFNKIRLLIHERRNPTDPWLTSHAVELLRQLINQEDVGVEFGSGRSTSWFIDRVSKLYSIESDLCWFEKLSAKNKSRILKGNLLYHHLTEKSQYSEFINTFSDESVNFCLIDGKYRDLCAIEMVPKIKKGGLLVVDNVNLYLPNDYSVSPDTRRRAEGALNDDWKRFAESVSSWRQLYTSNGITDTAIWIKK